MTREERILQLKDIINMVYRAENDVNAIKDVRDGKSWYDILTETKGADAETRDRIADEYVEAIAEQIMNKGYLRFEGDE